MNNNRLLTVLIVVAVLLLGLFAWFKWRPASSSPSNLSSTSTNSSISSVPAISQAELSKNYQDGVRAALTTFATQYRSGDAAAKKAAAQKAQQQLLALMVPVEDKDLHLQLVLALDQLSKGNVAGEKSFATAVASNSWIGSVSLH